MSFPEFTSAVFGWVYFLCWSLSFYPQSMLNYTRRSTSGTTVDFPLINCLGILPPIFFHPLIIPSILTYLLPGFLSYTISNFLFYSSPLIRSQYASRYHNLTPTVQLNDITFALHGLALSIICTTQYLLPHLWGFTPSKGNKPSRFILGIFFGCILGVVLVVFIVLSSSERNNPSAGGDRQAWIWLDAVYAISYVKLIVTLIKYTPQVLVNYRNKSTRGWSITQILLDFSGGVLSMGQQGIDSWLQGIGAGLRGIRSSLRWGM
ncbi:hypothetical protein B0T21DRAFT_187766 [Apiosordaria backusii]|uniref:Uncharacterized protein n=1 Tax=Apiosordaria backusii TaxID=314023 RepID=A0AA40ED21_9PEZI|nr:hypothetical protein B0T21DRAFT_187766 [Apiosordaria backusii]